MFEFSYSEDAEREAFPTVSSRRTSPPERGTTSSKAGGASVRVTDTDVYIAETSDDVVSVGDSEPVLREAGVVVVGTVEISWNRLPKASYDAVGKTRSSA
jgi:hypothetical protein